MAQLHEAIAHFEAAIARDSSFALAWSGLADAIDALAWRHTGALPRVPEAKYAAQRALLLEPLLAEAWASIGVLALDFDRDFRVAELALRRAIALQPSNSAAHLWLADVLRYSGRVEEALVPGARALELDPVSGLGMNGHLQTLSLLGRWPEARAVVDRLRAVGYTDLGSPVNVLSAAPHLGLGADQLAPLAAEWAGLRGYAHPEEAAVIGRAIPDPRLRPEALAVLRRMAAAGVNAPNIAELCITLGDRECALDNLERGVAEREPTMITVGTDWVYDGLRSDPRYVRVVEQLGLPNGR